LKAARLLFESHAAAAAVCCPVLQGELGELLPEAAADVILVDGDPLEDIAVLSQSSNIKLVVKAGLLAKVSILAGLGDIP
jgi:imidazolonepropionase-like amidohydrolase